jgi:hypothetical protein
MELQAAAQHGSQSVEENLQSQALRAEGGDVAVQCQLLAVRYYLKEVVAASTSVWEELAGGHTNYRALLSKIDRHRRDGSESVLLVSFNYDLLLEHALSYQFGIEKPNLASYPIGPYHLIKPHGSTHWFRINTKVEDLPPELVIKEGGVIDQSMPVTMSEQAKPGWLPALSVPTTSKSSFECPPEHERALANLLPEVDRLLVIGWKGQEQTFLDRVPTASLKASPVWWSPMRSFPPRVSQSIWASRFPGRQSCPPRELASRMPLDGTGQLTPFGMGSRKIRPEPRRQTNHAERRSSLRSPASTTRRSARPLVGWTRPVRFGGSSDGGVSDQRRRTDRPATRGRRRPTRGTSSAARSARSPSRTSP